MTRRYAIGFSLLLPFAAQCVIIDRIAIVVANRRIDQIFIRNEIELGHYPEATPQEADQQLRRLVSDKFKSDAVLQATLQKYGITVPDLKSYFLWQLTVLRFISTRFKPAVLVTDADIEKYYNQHVSYLKHEYPGKSTLNDVRGEITDVLAGERVDKLFFAWLDEQRKQTHIQYLEADLQ